MSTERLIPISQLDEIVKGSFPVSLQTDLSAPHVFIQIRGIQRSIEYNPSYTPPPTVQTRIYSSVVNAF